MRQKRSGALLYIHSHLGWCDQCHQARYDGRERGQRLIGTVVVTDMPIYRCPVCGDEAFDIGLLGSLERYLHDHPTASPISLDAVRHVA